MTKWIALGLCSALAGLAMGQSKIEPVSYRDVTLKDSFWAPRQKALDEVTLRQQFAMLEKHSYRTNFERAAARQTGGYVGLVFNDSDVYKVLEAAAFALGRNPQPWLDKKADEWIALVAKAQESDGYLNTHFQLMEPNRKWTNLRDQHELYCAGHLFEAAAEHFTATGKRNLLDVAIKLADHIDRRFGPDKKVGYPGHPETELALFKLWRVTKEPRYYKLAEYFLEARGSKWFATEHNTPLAQYHGEYWSDHLKIRDHDEIVGHAVRAAYLFSGATDWAHETGDKGVLAMLDRVWSSNVHKRMFITGGLGPSGSNEGFTVDYDLPTFTAYQESCASIANALWNGRLGLARGEARYSDVMETALYNGAMAGINLKGDRYYYVNPLANSGTHQRQEWFTCACCPPNLARMIGQVGGWAYAASPSAIYVNLFAQSTAKVKVAGQDAQFTVTTDYPWDGRVKIKFDRVDKSNFALKLRKPAWAGSFVTNAVLTGPGPAEVGSDGYITFKRTWKAGDTVEVTFPMPARRLVSHPNVKDTFGLFAFARGPIVYCAEAADNKLDFDALGVPLNAAVEAKPVTDPTLGRFVQLRTSGFTSPSASWSGKLFQPAAPAKPVTVTAIPYYAWNQRSPGPMRVWFSPNPVPAPLRGHEVSAKVSLSFKSGYAQTVGVQDGFVPAGSNPNSPQQTHFWPHKGGTETIEYTWSQAKKLQSARVYWFDDTGRGECKVPKSWRMEAWVNGGWKAVDLNPRDQFGLKLDTWNEIRFASVSTQRVRLVIEQQEGWASGVHEWQVFSE